MKSIGIIGAGCFGLFLAKHLSEHFEVKISSRSGKGGKWTAGLQEVAQCDYLILSIPLQAYETVLRDVAPLLGKHTVIVDVCSVKAEPISVIKSILPNQPVVATHPLFGPESAADTLEGHTLVVCPDESSAEPLEKISTFASSLGLEVVRMSCTEHDHEMAVVQGLTFFIARSLREMGIHDQRLATPTFKRLLYLAEIDSHHSDELFYTIQRGNTEMPNVRGRFMQITRKLNDAIEADPATGA